MRNKINLILFSSLLHDNQSVANSRKELFEGLRQLADVEITYPSLLATDQRLRGMIDGDRKGGFSLRHTTQEKIVCFIATGGTEEMFKTFVDVIPRPVLLLSDGLHNSMAAAFEIKTYLSQRGIPSTLFNAPLDYSPDFFEELNSQLFGGTGIADTLEPSNPLPKWPRNVVKAFEKTRIGLIGGASGWLIASEIDRESVEKTYGARFTDIPIEELEKTFAAIGPDDPEASAVCYRMERFLTGDRTREELFDAARMYLALKGLCTRYQLNALTLKCFGILSSCHTTACLALSLLNDEGIVAGCEGDIPSLWTMLYVKYAYGQEAFMANPSSSSHSEQTIDFAHCTVPLGMVHGYRLPSHFESQSGIGIAGSVPSGRYRIVKICGEKLDQFYETEGDLIMNTNIPQRCRTQIRFKFDSIDDFERFFRVSKGNHIILCKAAGRGVPSR